MNKHLTSIVFSFVFFLVVLTVGPGCSPCRGTPTIVPLTPVFSNAVSRAVPERLTLATYNVEHFSDGVKDGDRRDTRVAQAQAKGVAEILMSVDADIVLLQEIENGVALSMLNTALPEPYAFGYITDLGTAGHEFTKLNLGLLSRVPLENVREIDFGPLRGRERPTRGLLAFELPLEDNRRLLGYNVHLKSNYGSRQRNYAKRRNALIELVKDARQVTEAAPGVSWELFVAGDFNTDPDAESFREDPTLEPIADWTDAWRGKPIEERTTLPQRLGIPSQVFPSVAFDRVVVHPELTSAPWTLVDLTAIAVGVNTNDNTVMAPEGGHVSDHYPVRFVLGR